MPQRIVVRRFSNSQGLVFKPLQSNHQEIADATALRITKQLHSQLASLNDRDCGGGYG